MSFRTYMWITDLSCSLKYDILISFGFASFHFHFFFSFFFFFFFFFFHVPSLYLFSTFLLITHIQPPKPSFLPGFLYCTFVSMLYETTHTTLAWAFVFYSAPYFLVLTTVTYHVRMIMSPLLYFFSFFPYKLHHCHKVRVLLFRYVVPGACG